MTSKPPRTPSKPISLTIVIKLGTSTICDEKTNFPLLSNLSLLVETVIELRGLGHKIVLVTSGAIGVGLRRLNKKKKPKRLASIQVLLYNTFSICAFVQH